ncbi:MAG: carboxypeptidase regulatory-like domain-containing protein [Bacteroidales bacterium]|nr:carboxypeptidase regulatory-like domain-containing protein [Bacteroidales bacterium]
MNYKTIISTAFFLAACTATTAQNYHGGEGDGYDEASSANILPVTSLFLGGDGDGYQGAFSDSLMPVTCLFLGGIGDGYSGGNDPYVGLAAWYPFNGNALDESGNGNNGTVHGASLTSDRFGNTNRAYFFDGTGDHIDVNDSPSLDIIDAITVAAWFRFDAGGTENPRIVHKANAYDLYTRDTDNIRKIEGQCAGTWLVSQEIYEAGQWHFAAMTYDGQYARLYVNGQYVDSEQHSGSITTSNYDLNIGCNSYNQTDRFEGKIDDVRIFNRALSLEELHALFTEGGLSSVTLNGTITDQSTGLPVQGALVVLNKEGNNWYQTGSNTQGFYEFQNVQAGVYNLNVSKTGYVSDNRYVSLISQPVYTENFSLVPLNTNALEIIEGKLTAYAATITEIEQNYYKLSGNVNINGIVCFTDNIFVDKRNQLYYPEISGSCHIYATGIQGSNENIKVNNDSFIYFAKDNSLTPKNFGLLRQAAFSLGGFPVTIGQLVIDPQGTDVEVKSIVQFPFPLNKIIEAVQEECLGDVILFVEKVSSSRIFSKTNGIQTACNIEGLKYNFGFFKLEDVNYYYNTNQQIYGGGLKLVIPGIEPSTKMNSQDSLSQVKEDLKTLDVHIIGVSGDTLEKTNLCEIVEMQELFGSKLIEVGMQIEFVQGAINKLIISLGAKIPLDATGLFITEMSGGVDDLAIPGEWKIVAAVDIETGLEIPVLGSPIKFNDFGISIHPFSYFHGSGEFELFGHTVADGFITYDHSKKSLEGESNLNLYEILIGHNYINLKGGDFSGGCMATLKTPPDLPWPIKWASNQVFGSAEVNISNYHMLSQVELGSLSLAQKIQFGKQGFPWFHYYLGPNYNFLIKIWKGNIDGKQAITFQVQENTHQIAVFAGDTINHSIVDFIVTDPLGRIYDQGNTQYYHFPETDQTMMVIDFPMDGDWTFETPYVGPLAFEVMGINQPPTTLVSAPSVKGSKSNEISLSFNDYSDTLHVKVFYDTDNRHFDGSLVDEFKLVNNASVDFTWQNGDVPNGEYYIYCRIDDGYNNPVLQYAPGSIIVENDPDIETPQNLTVIQVADSVLVHWDQATWPNTVAAIVYYEDISTGLTGQKPVVDTNMVVIRELEYGREYRLWCRFINDNGTYSEPSNVESLVFTSAEKNNPPYFTLEKDSVWLFVADETDQYIIRAKDADGNILTFQAPGDTLGVAIADSILTWTPINDQRGFYNLMLTVTDGTAWDTTYQKVIVYTQEQMEVRLAFSSLNLYEDDNMYVKIRNFRSTDPYQDVTLTNMNTGEQAIVQCRKVNRSDYLGRFSLSFVKNSEISVSNGDTIQAEYLFNTEIYKAKAYYDSLPQPSDQIPPSVISDLTVSNDEINSLLLTWTAPGDDDTSGTSYRYDLRYSFSPILTEDDYLTAFLVPQITYPSEAGTMDSLVIDLSKLTGVIHHDTIFFSIKAEDEMQNRGGLGICAAWRIYYAPEEVKAEGVDVYKVHLSWTHPAISTEDTISLQSFRIYRKFDDNNFVSLTDTVTGLSWTDDLYNHPDGNFVYAVSAVFNTGQSNMAFSDTLEMKRFADIRIMCDLSDTISNSIVQVIMIGLDTVYQQQFSYQTNPTGLLLINDVFKTSYKIDLSKPGYIPIADTIQVTDQQVEFSYIMHPVGLMADLRAFLEGPFNGTGMNTSLNPADIPLSQPYNVPPWNYYGTESVAAIPGTDVVDWVLLELRDTPSAAQATGSTMIAMKAAFILSEGSVVGLDGISPLQFSSVSVQYGLFPVLWHRNHLGIMSAIPVIESCGVYTYDFSTGSGQVHGGALGYKQLSPGIWGMVGADGNADGNVNNLDKNDVWTPQGGSSGYFSGDFNMDTQVNNMDKIDVWVPNGGAGSQVPENMSGAFRSMVPK